MMKLIRTSRLSIKNSLSVVQIRRMVKAKRRADQASLPPLCFFFFIDLQPLKKISTTNYAPFALDRELGSLADILIPA